MLLKSVEEIHSLGALRPQHRLCAITALQKINDIDIETALKIDRGLAQRNSRSYIHYTLAVKRFIFNFANNPSLLSHDIDTLLFYTDEQLAAGTMVEKIQKEEHERREAFLLLLKEKTENIEKMVDKRDSVLKCRRCNSSSIQFTQKQLRGADEPMTVFCVCEGCKLKWRMN